MRIFSGKRSKRGALDLSINAIVVLILAITMLGLGLAFIRGLFGGAVQKLTDIYGSLNEEDKKTLMTSQEQVTFLQSDIQVSGRSVNIPFAIRNVRGSRIGLKIKNNFFCFDAIGVPKQAGQNSVLGRLVDTTYGEASTGGTQTVSTTRIAQDICAGTFGQSMQASAKWITFGTYDERDLDSNQAVVLPLTINVASDAPSTTYSCAFFPTVIRTETTQGSGAGATSTFSAVQPSQQPECQSGYQIYQKQYFNIVYTK